MGAAPVNWRIGARFAGSVLVPAIWSEIADVLEKQASSSLDF